MSNKIRYCDNGEFMQRAYALYIQQGFTGKKIAEVLRKDYPGLCRQTVCKIIDEFGWQKQRHDFHADQCDLRKEKNLYLKQVKFVAERLYNKISGSDNGDITNQHFSLYLRCIEMIGKLEGWETGKGDGVLATDMEMQNFLRVLQEDPVIGRNLKSRKKILEKEYRKRTHGINKG